MAARDDKQKSEYLRYCEMMRNQDNQAKVRAHFKAIADKEAAADDKKSKETTTDAASAPEANKPEAADNKKEDPKALTPGKYQKGQAHVALAKRAGVITRNLQASGQEVTWKNFKAENSRLFNNRLAECGWPGRKKIDLDVTKNPEALQAPLEKAKESAQKWAAKKFQSVKNLFTTPKPPPPSAKDMKEMDAYKLLDANRHMSDAQVNNQAAELRANIERQHEERLAELDEKYGDSSEDSWTDEDEEEEEEEEEDEEKKKKKKEKEEEKEERETEQQEFDDQMKELENAEDSLTGDSRQEYNAEHPEAGWTDNGMPDGNVVAEGADGVASAIEATSDVASGAAGASEAAQKSAEAVQQGADMAAEGVKSMGAMLGL